MVIYIQEDGWSILHSLISGILPEVWKGIVSGCVAFLCASAMVILAINHKKGRK